MYEASSLLLNISKIEALYNVYCFYVAFRTLGQNIRRHVQPYHKGTLLTIVIAHTSSLGIVMSQPHMRMPLEHDPFVAQMRALERMEACLRRVVQQVGPESLRRITNDTPPVKARGVCILPY